MAAPWIALLLAAQLGDAPSPMREVERLHGVLSNRPVEWACTLFEADDGRTFILSTTEEFQLGDRIFVAGTIPTNTAGVCNEVVYPLLDVRFIHPAFAGIGTIVQESGQHRLRTDDGRDYGLRNRRGFAAGARVFVRGWVDATQNPPVIEQNAIGAAVSGFGRFLGSSSTDRRILGEDGATYLLDNLSARFVEQGDLIYFEGIHASGEAVEGGQVQVVRSNGRYAFHATGRIVLENGGKVVNSDQLFFDDTFAASGLDTFAVGEKAFVLGIAPQDYDHGEPRNGRTIRSSRTGPGYSSTGTFQAGGLFVAADQTVLEVDYPGTLPLGTLAYIAGELDTSGPGLPVVRTNIVLFGIDTTGTLEIGFECAPLLIGSGIFFVENEEGIPFHNSARAIGGVSFDAAPCPFAAIVDDELIDLGGGKK
jgi:hypothetical protein